MLKCYLLTSGKRHKSDIWRVYKVLVEGLTLTLGELDETRCGMRLILCLNDVGRSMIQTEIHDEMRKRYRLGRKVVDSALQVAIKHKLVKRETRRMGSNPMPSLFHTLTPQGKKIASIIKECESALI